MKEFSFGIIPLKKRKLKNKWVYWTLLVQHKHGHFAFPKGHAEKDEEPKETAERELFEETGLVVARWLPLGPFSESYVFQQTGKLIFKEVTYFPALVKGKVIIQQEELIGASWVELEKAESMITFKEGKRVCAEVISAVVSSPEASA